MPFWKMTRLVSGRAIFYTPLLPRYGNQQQETDDLYFFRMQKVSNGSPDGCTTLGTAFAS